MTAKATWLIQSVEGSLLPKHKTVEDHTHKSLGIQTKKVRIPVQEFAEVFS